MRTKDEIIDDILGAVNQPVIDWIVDLVQRGELEEATRVLGEGEGFDEEDAQVFIDEILDHLFNV